MNKINLNLDHCFGLTKLSQELTFDGENAVLIYAPNGLMKTSFAKTLQLYGQGKTDKVKGIIFAKVQRRIKSKIRLSYRLSFKLLVVNQSNMLHR